MAVVRRETAVDERRKETADRVAKYQTGCIYTYTMVGPVYAASTRTAAAASGAFVVLRFCCFLSRLGL